MFFHLCRNLQKSRHELRMLFCFSVYKSKGFRSMFVPSFLWLRMDDPAPLINRTSAPNATINLRCFSRSLLAFKRTFDRQRMSLSLSGFRWTTKHNMFVLSSIFRICTIQMTRYFEIPTVSSEWYERPTCIFLSLKSRSGVQYMYLILSGRACPSPSIYRLSAQNDFITAA